MTNQQDKKNKSSSNDRSSQPQMPSRSNQGDSKGGNRGQSGGRGTDRQQQGDDNQ